MADENKPKTQRINRRNRKDKIEVDHSKFMPPQVDLPDLSELDIPEADEEALAALQRMDDIARPLVVTPQEERYPPLPADHQPAPTGPTRQSKPVYRRAKHSRRNNFLTLLFLLSTIGVLAFYGLIWTDPQTPLNLLAPPTSFRIVTATADPNPVFVPTVEPTLDVNQPTPTVALSDTFPFAVAPEGVLYVSNQNGRACNWASIAGAVTNADNSPLPGFGVRVAGDGVSATVFSGTNSSFGDGGYELNLGGAPMVSTFTVHLVTTGGAPLSDVLTVTTRDDCNQNVVIINFIQR